MANSSSTQLQASDSKIVSKLLQHGAAINIEDNTGEAPLYVASQKGNTKEVSFLLQHGATINIQDTNGKSPLYIASQRGHIQVVSLLLQNGAAINLQCKDGVSPLWIACYKGHTEVVSMLLKHGADSDLDNNNGTSPLYVASQNGHTQVASLLLQHGAAIDLQNNTGASPLFVAIKNGHTEVASLLLKHGAAIDLQCKDGVSPLWIACYKGHTEVVSMLLQHGADSHLHNSNNNGTSPLYLASQNGHTQVISCLLKHGAAIDLQNNTGASPLYVASQNGHTEVASLLLQHGAAIDLRCKDGVSPLWIASFKGHTDVVSMLLQHGADSHLQKNSGASPLYVASQNGHTEVVSLLLKHGATIDLQNNSGASPLYVASQNGHTEVVFLLLQKGAAVDIQNTTGASPLYVASQNGHTEVASLLLQHGAAIDLQRKNGLSPLLIASYQGHIEVVSMLLQHGSECHLHNNCNGISPLYLASQNGHTEVASLLLQHGAAIDLQCKDGVSALWIASYQGRTEVVSLLLQHGADINLQRKDGVSPLWAASDQGRTEVVSLLLQHGADINLQNNTGTSPLYVASQEGHTEVVFLLLQQGADINLLNKYGVSPLMEASIKGHLEVVSMLLQNGADIYRHDNNRESPLHTAWLRGNTEVVSLLLKHGADIHLQDNKGALPQLAFSQKVDEVESLVQHGVDIRPQDKKEINDTFNSSIKDFPHYSSEVVSAVQPTLGDIKHNIRKQDVNLEQIFNKMSVEKEEGKDPNIRGQNLEQTCDNGGAEKVKKKDLWEKEGIKEKLSLKKQRKIKVNTTSRNLDSAANSKMDKKNTNQERVLTSLYISVPPQQLHTNSPPSRQDEPNRSTLINFSKDFNIGEHNLLTTYTAVQQTQTDDDPQKRNVPFSSICTQWQVTATFTSAGGSVCKPRSDVVLTVPPGAVEKGMYRDVYMAVCTDIPHIHKLLGLPDVYIASPVAEFWSNDDEVFKKPIQIYLPHSLTLPSEQNDVKVYRMTTDPTGKLTLQVLHKDIQTDGEGTEETIIPESQTGTFHFSADGRICVVTDRFSAYVCLRCGHSNKGPPNICVIGCGTNSYRGDGYSTGSVRVAVWDLRLSIKDFQPADAVSCPQVLTLPLPINNKNSLIGMKLHCGQPQFQPEWTPINYEHNADVQPEEQFVVIESVLNCDNTNCRCSPDHSTAWQMETAQPSTTPPMLRCCVVITYWPNADNLQETMSSNSRRIGRITIDVNPLPECPPPPPQVNVVGEHVVIGGEQNIVKTKGHKSSSRHGSPADRKAEPQSLSTHESSQNEATDPKVPVTNLDENTDLKVASAVDRRQHTTLVSDFKIFYFLAIVLMLIGIFITLITL